MVTETHSATTADCIIIGAGHVGLSVARGLKEQGVNPILLDQHEAIGDSWRHRYERLHLHHITDAMYLPDVRFPKHVARYPSRLDLAEYMQAYAALHDLDVRLQHRVQQLLPAADGWQLDVLIDGGTTPTQFNAKQVVLAGGATGITPRLPTIEGADTWDGHILHSKKYFNAEPFRGQRVLVVGSGNSAIEILCDLYDNGAQPAILMRSGNAWVTREGFANYHRILAAGAKILQYVPFTWLAAPIVMRLLDRYFMWDVKRKYGDLETIGIATDPNPPMLRMAKTRGAKAPSYIDGTWGDVGVSVFDLIKDGEVTLYDHEISHLDPGRQVTFTDGKVGEFDAIVLCTGFEPVLSHYATFLAPEITQTIEQQGLQPMSEVPGYKGLWPALGGIATSRYGLQVLAKRVAAKIKNQKPPGRVLNQVVSFVLAGPDPGLIQIPKRTIAINLFAAAWLVYALV